MPNFSKQSEDKLITCDDRLQKLFREVVKTYDCTILVGHRGEEEQNEAFRSGRSKLPWPKGEHNADPSKAVDVAPYPIDFNNKPKSIARFYHFAGYVLRVAEDLGLKIRWGGDWDSDKLFNDQNFDDLDHFEIKD